MLVGCAFENLLKGVYVRQLTRGQKGAPRLFQWVEGTDLMGALPSAAPIAGEEVGEHTGGVKSECDGLFTNRLLWLDASAGALPLRGSGCRNLAPPERLRISLTAFSNSCRSLFY